MSIPLRPEQILEDHLVAQLIGLDYRRAAVTDEASMGTNLKTEHEAFNGVSLSDGEFTKVLHHLNKKSGVFNKAHTLRDRRHRRGAQLPGLLHGDAVADGGHGPCGLADSRLRG